MNGVSAAVTKSEDLSILLVFSINTTQPVFSISNPNNRAFIAFAMSKLFFAHTSFGIIVLSTCQSLPS
ncbi:hypothetical protein AYX14_07144 [Cryptococcus neoformans]|nr:hypothetical protein AYX14_07144 [Cryptococcus neoformans var. grubii]